MARQRTPAMREELQTFKRGLIVEAAAKLFYERGFVGTTLEAIADEIDGADGLVARAMQESGLPEARITMERGRTTNQLRLFARVAREGSALGVRIDRADPDRQPLPKPDVAAA